MSTRKIKGGGKRDDHERARDRALVAEYHLKGLSFAQIANELNNRHGVPYTLSAETVRRDYQTNIEVWNEQALTPTGADIQAQEERLRLVEVEAWAAWERSKDPAEQVREVQKLIDIYDPKTGSVVDRILATESVEKLIKGQVGDEKFLRVVLDCWDKRAKLHGMYTTKYQIGIDVHEEKEVTYKMYGNVSPMMWDDPSVQVIDGRIMKDGRPVEIIDGQVLYLEEGQNGDNAGHESDS